MYVDKLPAAREDVIVLTNKPLSEKLLKPMKQCSMEWVKDCIFKGELVGLYC